MTSCPTPFSQKFNLFVRKESLIVPFQSFYLVIDFAEHGMSTSLSSQSLYTTFLVPSLLADAHSVLDELVQPNVVSWSACCMTRLKMLEAMQLSGVSKRVDFFICPLRLQSFLAFEGLQYFKSMGIDYGLNLSL